MTQSLNKSSRALILELINAANQSAYTEDDFTWGTPMPVRNRPDGRNTVLELSNVPAADGMVGRQSIVYTRLDFSQLFAGATLSFEDSEEFLTTADILTVINTQYNLSLTEDDIVIKELKRVGEAPYVNTLRANKKSLAYVGETTFSLTTEASGSENNYITNGFLFVNSAGAMKGPSIDQLNAIETDYVPVVPATDAVEPFTPVSTPDAGSSFRMQVATGGYQNEIYAPATAADGTSLDLHYSLDGGQTWAVQNFPNLVLYRRASNAVFFKGYCYFAAARNAAKSDEGSTTIYRVIPPAQADGEHTLEAVISVLQPMKLLADDNMMAFVSAVDGQAYITSNGVDWNIEIPADTLTGGCLHNGKLCLLAFNMDTMATTFLVRESANVYSVKSIPPLDVSAPWVPLQVGSISTGDKLRIVITHMGMFSQTITVGDILETSDFGETWTLTHSQTGVYAIDDALDDGETIVMLGAPDDLTGMGGGPVAAKAAVSTDRAETFNFLSSQDFPALSQDNRRTLGAIVRRKSGTKPALPPASQTLTKIYDYPFGTDETNTFRSITAYPDGRFAMGGANVRNLDSINNVNDQALSVPNLAIFDADGILLDTSHLSGVITNVLYVSATHDNKLLLVCNTPERSGYGSTILRLNSDLSLDETFISWEFDTTIGSNQYVVDSVQALPDGRFMAAGPFTTIANPDVIAGTMGIKAGAARFNADGTLDSTYRNEATSPYPTGLSYVGDGRVKLLPSGKAVLNIRDDGVSRLLVLDAEGDDIPGLDLDDVHFVTAGNEACELSNGDIVITCSPGSTSPYYGQKILKLRNDGTVDAALPVNDLIDVNSRDCLLALPDDSVLVNASQDPTDNYNRLLQLKTDGTVVSNWSGIALQDTFRSMARLANGDIAVALSNRARVRQGAFPNYNTALVNRLFRFKPDA